MAPVSSKCQWCSAANCSNSRNKNPKLSFFRFPKDEERARQWVINCRRVDLENKPIEALHRANSLCAEHFEESCFTVSSFTSFCTRKRLKSTALPTLFKFPNHSTIVTPKSPPPKEKELLFPTESPPPKEKELVFPTESPPPKEKELVFPTESPPPKEKELVFPTESPPPKEKELLFPTKSSLPKEKELLFPTVDNNCNVHVPEDTCNVKSEPGCSSTEEKIAWQRKLNAERSRAWRLRKKLGLNTITTPSLTQYEVRKENRLLQTMHRTLSKYLSPTAVDFIMTQVRVSRAFMKGRRWKNSDRSLALTLYHASGEAYALLQKLFQLPSPRTLCKTTQDIQIQTGVSEDFMSLFKIKVEAMPSQERICAVILDEMALKSSLQYNAADDEVEGFEDYGPLGRTQKLTNQALLFMVQGLTSKWKQPVSYVLSNGPVKASTSVQLLMHVIENITKIGLIPKVVICKQSTNKRAMFRLLGINYLNPFFVCNDQKIFALFDPPHLLKSVRDNFKLHGYTLDGHIISWDHVVTFYKADRSNPIRLAPTLTDAHIYLKPFSQIGVKVATQVLSYNVAAGIACMARVGALPPDAIHTAHFIERFAQLFNCFNSRSPKAKASLRRAISASSGHMAFLNQTLVWLEGLKCNNKNTKLSCIEGWKLAISCLKQLWDELSSFHGFSFLLTDRLNQNCIADMFSTIQGKGECYIPIPDPCQFRSSLRQSMIDLFMVSNDHKDSKDNLDSFSLESVQSESSNVEIKSLLGQDVLPPLQKFMMASATPSLTMAEDNVVAHIAGYVASKLSSVVCLACCQLLVAGETGSPSKAHRFKQAKAYQQSVYGGLKTPSDVLLSALQAMETIFRAIVDRVLNISGVRMLIVTRLMKEEASKELVCHRGMCNLQFNVTSLFANIRLHHHLKLRNRLLATKKRGLKRPGEAAAFCYQ